MGAAVAAPSFAGAAAARARTADPFPGLLGPADGVADLSRNENPYGPPASALRMVEYGGLKGAYYPMKAAGRLAEMIAERHDLTPDHVAVTTGSSEALCALAVMFGRKGPAVAPRLFFDFPVAYAVDLDLATLAGVPMAADLSTDLPGLEAAANAGAGFVQICNPNNPTGELIPGDRLKPAVVRMAKKSTVIVDEAYMELAADPEANSCIDLVRAGHDVVVTRTFSKIYGMAGLRVGYAIAAPDTAARISRACMTWNSGPGLAAAVGCYNDEKFLAGSLSKVREGREMAVAAVEQLGLAHVPSSANFLFFRTDRPADAVRDDFEARGVIVRGRYFDYEGWTRVSMGRLEDVERFCRDLPAVVRA